MIWLFLWKLLVFHGIPLSIFIHRHLQPPRTLPQAETVAETWRKAIYDVLQVTLSFFESFSSCRPGGYQARSCTILLFFCSMLSIHDDKLINCAFEHEHHDHELYHEHQRCWLKIVLSRIDVAGIPWSFNTQFPMSAPQKKKKFPWSLKIIVFKIIFSRGWFSGSMLNSRGLFGSLGHLMF